MHPILVHRTFLSSRSKAATRPAGLDAGPLRRWLRRLGRQWKRRRMIAEFQAMDDWILRDIGIARGDIRGIVDGLCDRELSMVPTARLSDEARASDDPRPSEPTSADAPEPDAICRLAA